MILRAAFFIGLVAVLMPHEPDIGLGRPGVSLCSLSRTLSAVGLSRSAHCDSDESDSSPVTMASVSNGRSLADIKAEIGAAVRSRRAARD